MWIWYAILFIGACQLAYSAPHEEVDVSVCGDKLADHLIAELKKNFGPNWEEKVPELVENLKGLAQKFKNDDKLADEVVAPHTPDMMLIKWKKVLEDVLHTLKVQQQI